MSAQEILDDNSQRKRCLGTSTLTLMYGPLNESKADRHDREAIARDLCRGCSLLDPCLEVELSLGVSKQHGFRGGMSESERKTLLRRARSKAVRE